MTCQGCGVDLTDDNTACSVCDCCDRCGPFGDCLDCREYQREVVTERFIRAAREVGA